MTQPGEAIPSAKAAQPGTLYQVPGNAVIDPSRGRSPFCWGGKRGARKSPLSYEYGSIIRYCAILAGTNSISCQQSSGPDIIGCKVPQSGRRDLNPKVGAEPLRRASEPRGEFETRLYKNLVTPFVDTRSPFPAGQASQEGHWWTQGCAEGRSPFAGSSEVSPNSLSLPPRMGESRGLKGSPHETKVAS